MDPKITSEVNIEKLPDYQMPTIDDESDEEYYLGDEENSDSDGDGNDCVQDDSVRQEESDDETDSTSTETEVSSSDD